MININAEPVIIPTLESVKLGDVFPYIVYLGSNLYAVDYFIIIAVLQPLNINNSKLDTLVEVSFKEGFETQFRKMWYSEIIARQQVYITA